MRCLNRFTIDIGENALSMRSIRGLMHGLHTLEKLEHLDICMEGCSIHDSGVNPDNVITQTLSGYHCYLLGDPSLHWNTNTATGSA